MLLLYNKQMVATKELNSVIFSEVEVVLIWKGKK